VTCWHGVSDPGLGGESCLARHAGGLQRSRRLRGEAECCEWLCRGTGIGLHLSFGCGWFLCMAGFLPGVVAFWGYGFGRHDLARLGET